MSSWPTAALVAAAALLVGTRPSPRQQAAPGPVFRASGVLERRAPGAPPRVRFEWTHRSGAVEYLLIGSWTRIDTWTIERREFRVTPRTATTWNPERITFEVPLPPGDHSWKLAPVRQPNGPGQSDGGAQVGFELR